MTSSVWSFTLLWCFAALEYSPCISLSVPSRVTSLHASQHTSPNHLHEALVAAQLSSRAQETATGSYTVASLTDIPWHVAGAGGGASVLDSTRQLLHVASCSSFFFPQPASISPSVVSCAILRFNITSAATTSYQRHDLRGFWVVYSMTVDEIDGTVFVVGKAVGRLNAPAVLEKIPLLNFGLPTVAANSLQLDINKYKEVRSVAVARQGVGQGMSTVGTRVCDRDFVDSQTVIAGKVFLLLNRGQTDFVHHGLVEAWSVSVADPGTLVLQVWRPAMPLSSTAPSFMLVGENQITATVAGKQSFPIATGERIAVRQGDVIGFWVPTTAPQATLQYSNLGENATASQVIWTTTGRVVVGGQVSFGASSAQGNREYSIAAHHRFYQALGHAVVKRQHPHPSPEQVIEARINSLAVTSLPRPSPLGGGASFGPSSSYVEIPSTVIPAQKAFTIEVWVSPSAASTTSKTLWGQAVWQTGDLRVRIRPDGHVAMSLRGNDPEEVVFGPALPALAWTHVALTYSQVARQVALFLNGTFVEYQAIELAKPFAPASAIRVGLSADGGLVGLMQDLRLWAATRSPQQILSLFRSTLTKDMDLSDLLLYFPLLNDVLDYSGNDYQSTGSAVAFPNKLPSPSPTPVPSTVVLNPSLRFSTNGTIRLWEAFSCALSFPASISFQVWRQSGTSLVLVGQNQFALQAADTPWLVLPVPQQQQISYQAGDIIGFVESAGGVLCFDNATSPLGPSAPGEVFVAVSSAVLPVNGSIAGYQVQTLDTARLYSLAAHSDYVNVRSLVLASYSMPSRLCTINADTLQIIQDTYLQDVAGQSMISAIAVDDVTHHVIATVNTNPATLLRIDLSTLQVERSLVLNDTFGAFGLVLDPTTAKAFVVTGTQIVRVGVRWLEREGSGLVVGGVRSVALNRRSGVLYLGTLHGQILTVHGGCRPGFRHLELLATDRIFDDGDQLDAVNAIHVCDSPICVAQAYNQSVFNLFAVSTKPDGGGLVLSKLQASGVPVLVQMSPRVGHISGGTRVLATTSHTDTTTRATVLVAANQVITLSALRDGAVRVVGTGGASLTGRVEYFRSNQWFSLCGKKSVFDGVAAGVVCRSAGYPGGSLVGQTSTVLGSGVCSTALPSACATASSAILQASFQCVGHEQDLSECRVVSGQLPCSDHTSDAVVTCFPNPTTVPVSLDQDEFADESAAVPVSVYMPCITGPATVNLSLVNAAQFVSSASLAFEYYNAVVTSVSPNNMPFIGTTDLTFSGTSFACDLDSIRVRFVNASGYVLTTPLSFAFDCSQTSVGVTVTTQGSAPLPASVFVQLSLDGQFWLGAKPITLADLQAGDVSPSLCVVGGGCEISLSVSGVPGGGVCEAALFASLEPEAQPLAITTCSLAPDTHTVRFTVPAYPLAEEVYWGVSFNQQNFDISSVPFAYFNCSFASLSPSVAIVDGGTVVQVFGAGFIPAPLAVAAITVPSGQVLRVPVTVKGTDSLSFKLPSSSASGVAQLQIALDGIMFQNSGLSVQYVRPLFTTVSPLFMPVLQPVSIALAGSDFPLVAPGQCLVSISHSTDGDQPRTVAATVMSSSLISVPASSAETTPGPSYIKVSFDGGKRFFDVTTSILVYRLKLQNLAPASVVANIATTVRLMGSGFFDPSPYVVAVPVSSRPVVVLHHTVTDVETTTALTYVSSEQLSFVLPVLNGGDSSQVGGMYRVFVMMGPNQARVESAKQLLVIPQPTNPFANV
eukprot:c7491_g1_i1.p1 GENE.c7491_g1_i1~~c7491_g1_i1.p1  ORF type:complete len:1745 (+),score=455.56 c7491_g1_i1:38-5236(+)